MAKKKSKQQEKVSQQTPEHYRVGEWKGMPKYECAYCAFDALSKAAIEEHYQARHVPPPPPPKPHIPVYDRWGNEVKPASEEAQEEVTDGKDNAD